MIIYYGSNTKLIHHLKRISVPTQANYVSLLNFFNVYLFLRERERERDRDKVRVGEEEREGDTESELSAQSSIWGSNSRTMRS